MFFLVEKLNLDPEECSLIWPIRGFGRELAAGQGMVFYLKALNDKCSTCCVVAEKIILDIHYFKPLKVSAIHVFLGGNLPLDHRALSFTSSTVLQGI